MRGYLFELPFTILLIIAGLGGVFMLAILAYSNLSVSAELIAGNEHRFNAVDAVHAIDYCMQNGEGVIRESFLEENKGKNVCDVCRICEVTIQSTVRDLSAGNKEWGFDYDKVGVALSWLGDHIKNLATRLKVNPHADEKMIVSISMGNGEIHVGELSVWT